MLDERPTHPGVRLRLVIQDEDGGARLTPALVARLLDQVRGASSARYITLESESESFCEGLHLGGLATNDAAQRELAGASLAAFAELLAALERAAQPVIALVNGPALGGGVGLAAAADLTLAVPGATFALPETLLGLIPAMVFPVIARRIGGPRTRLMALGAPPLSAQEAHRVGLVDEVVTDLSVGLARYSRRMLRMDARALGEVKALTSRYCGPPAGYAEDAAARFHALLASPDTQSRLNRFAAGETPWPEDEL